MNYLIIGGTLFLGPAMVDAALASGHEVTLFNRGITASDAIPDVETIIGDREFDLERLAGRRWDAVIDTCGYLPRLVRLSAEALRDAVDHYTFISTISVYPPAGEPNRDETAAVLTIEDETVEEVTDESYGPLKVLCERAIQDAFPDRNLIIRSGLIVGPQDPSNRFTYWVTRAARGGAAIAPPAGQPIQFVDARDIAGFTVRQTEARASAVYNVTGPAERMTFGELLPIVKHALNSDVRFHHVGDDFLRENAVGEFMELPLWVNSALAESFMTFDIGAALHDGLSFRPLAATIRDTWQWARTLPEDIPKPADLPSDKEADLLNAWRSNSATD